jgi:hypothetical protein
MNFLSRERCIYHCKMLGSENTWAWFTHTWFVKLGTHVRRQTWNQKLLPLQLVVSPCQRPVDHSATSTQKLTVTPLQPVVSPCQRPVDHSATSTQKLTVAVRV